MRAKRRWAAFAATVGLLAGSLGGGIALGESGDAMQQDDAMEQSAPAGDAMQSESSGDAMQQQDPAAEGAAMSAARMTG